MGLGTPFVSERAATPPMCCLESTAEGASLSSGMGRGTTHHQYHRPG